MSDKTEKPSGTKLDRDAIIAMTNKMVTGEMRKRNLLPQAPKNTEAKRADFTSLPVYQQMQTQKVFADLASLDDPYFQLHDGRAGVKTEIDGRQYLNYASYDYLGLNAEARVGAAAKQAIDHYGTSVSASRPTAGDRPLHRKLEKQLADLYRTEEALLFVSGHATNVSTIGDLMDPQDCILFDALSHNSITVGAKLSGAARRRYAHNDLDELEAILAQSRERYKRVLIVVEGLYSMDGDLADLPRLVEIKQKYDAWLMVDEAHALGVLGAAGRGSFEHFDLDPAGVDIWMGTLSKTLSSCGGYIAGDSALIDILKFHASGFMFSVGMAPPVAAAASRALEIMLEEPERVARLQSNGRFFLNQAQRAGLDTGLSQGFSVVPILVGDSLRTVRLSNILMEKGVYTIPVIHPAVAQKEARIRFFITSEHTEEQLETTVELLADELGALVRDNYGLSSLGGQDD